MPLCARLQRDGHSGETVRILVIGSSDTGGANLADPNDAYPQVVKNELAAALGQECHVVNLPVVHVGPKAVPRVEAALEREQPDIVIFGYGAYSFIIATVSQRVRRRYGERTYQFFHKWEVRFEKKTGNSEGTPARTNHWGRWLTRRIIGAEAPATRDEVVGIQTAIVNMLAQREGTTTVMLGAPDVPEALVRENPKANILLGEHREYMTALARSHHFLIADCVQEFRDAPVRERLSTSDSIHKSADGHRIQADAIMKVLLSPPSPFAPDGDGTRTVRQEAQTAESPPAPAVP